MTDFQVENEALKTRIEVLESDLEKANSKSFWKIDSWQDMFKVASVPLALALTAHQAYDKILLRWMGRDAVTVASVTSNLRNLQELNAKTYQMQATQDQAKAGAFEAANVGLRQRLVSETYSYWQAQPGFFQPSEAQMLADQLLLQERTQDASIIAQTLDETARTPRAKAELALFKGRIFGAQGDAFDLERARGYLRDAVTLSQEIPISSQSHAMFEQVVYYRVYMELFYEQDCDLVGPMVDALQEMSLQGTAAEGQQDIDAAQLVDIYKGRCGA